MEDDLRWICWEWRIWSSFRYNLCRSNSRRKTHVRVSSKISQFSTLFLEYFTATFMLIVSGFLNQQFLLLESILYTVMVLNFQRRNQVFGPQKNLFSRFLTLQLNYFPPHLRNLVKITDSIQIGTSIRNFQSYCLRQLFILLTKILPVI